MPQFGQGVRILRLVIACPGDVQDEAGAISPIVEELNRSVAGDRGLRVEVERWKSHAYPGFHDRGPQGLIDPLLRIPECDVLIGIFWRRFGTPTDASLSGTEHEIRLAIESWKAKKTPQVMMYFNLQGVTPQTIAEYEQYGNVLKFRNEFPKEGLWWGYHALPEFEDLVRNHLTNYLRFTFPLNGSQQDNSTWLPGDARTDYFAVQRTVVQEYCRTFIGRIYAVDAFDAFIRRHDRGYFIVQGGPGQGKTALACALIKRWSAVHHLVSRSSGRTDDRLILRSLIAQIPGAQRPVSESISELTKVFEEAIPRAVTTSAPAVVVIDAIDELPGDACDDSWLAIEALPPNVYVVVTSRPGERLERLLERLYAVPHTTYELGPMTLAEMHNMLSSRALGISGSELERICEASQGNPLYLRAVADELGHDANFRLDELPRAVEGFFRKVTSELNTGNRILADVLAVLSVARTALSVRDLSAITGVSQRELDERAIHPIRSFLLEVNGRYTFYHARFHDFVTHEIVYEDERRAAHSKIVDWLERQENAHDSYRFDSLAFHVLESGDVQRLDSLVDPEFLERKLRRSGYAVLEDLELLTRSLLARNDPRAVDRCMFLMDGVRRAAGGDIIQEASRALQAFRAGPHAFRTKRINPAIPSCPGLDVFAAVLPKGEVAADFVDLVVRDHHLYAAIGDAPAIGLRSAFLARFLGNTFRHCVGSAYPGPRPAAAIHHIAMTVSGFEAFNRVSLQCVQIDPQHNILRIASAGHPDPVHYVARRKKCDILPLRSPALIGDLGGDGVEEFDVDFGRGDILVLVSDGLTDEHIVRGGGYDYSFTRVVEDHPHLRAERLVEAILASWRAHPREEDIGDDASIVVVKSVDVK